MTTHGEAMMKLLFGAFQYIRHHVIAIPGFREPYLGPRPCGYGIEMGQGAPHFQHHEILQPGAQRGRSFGWGWWL